MLTVPQTPIDLLHDLFPVILYGALTNWYHSVLDTPFHLSCKALIGCIGKTVTPFHGEQCCLVLPNLLSPILSSWFKGSLSRAFISISNPSNAGSDQCLLILPYPCESQFSQLCKYTLLPVLPISFIQSLHTSHQ